MRVTLHGPDQVTVGESATYTMTVSWSQQRPVSMRFSFQPAAGTPGCQRPSSPPATYGPGSATVSGTTTFTKAGDVDVIAVALSGCQYFEGSGRDDFIVHVASSTPSPSATPSAG